jgi:hypothetical protein
MEKLTLSNVEHAFYQSGEAGGAAGALERVSKELRQIILRHNFGASGMQAIKVLIDQIEAESAQRRQIYGRLIGQALQLRKTSTPLLLKVKRAAKAFMAELEG